MNCHEFRQWLDDLLVREPGEFLPADVAQHLAGCTECAREYALAREAVEAITPQPRIGASPQLKERIMNSIPATALNEDRTTASRHLTLLGDLQQEIDDPRVWTVDSSGVPTGCGGVPRRRVWRAWMVAAIAAGVLLALGLLPFRGGSSRLLNGRALSLLAEASAAEARFFADDRLVSLSNEIVIEPVEDAELIAMRWLPLIVIGADGKPRFHQLKLAGEPGWGYTVRDQSWYDPATHRFARVLSLAGRTLFANAFDGRAIHLLELDDHGRPRIKDEPVAGDFQPPKNPAEFLGIAAGVTSAIDQPDRRDLVRDEGPTKLADGTPARVVRLYSAAGGADTKLDAYFRATIRDDNHTLESFELVTSGRTLFRVRLARAAESYEPKYGWDLAGIRRDAEGQAKPPVQTLANLVILNVSVDDMVKRADYPVYVFARNPSWAGERQIMDILDLVSPPHRLFAAIYPAKDKRHVVLVQAFTFNAKLGPHARSGNLVYTSPQGVKVWSGKQDQWLAEILLSSARASIADPPAKDRTSYLLETPDGTFPALAVNGTLTEAELHELVDSLMPARPK